MNTLFVIGYLLLTVIVVYAKPKVWLWTLVNIIFFALFSSYVGALLSYVLFCTFATITAVVAIFGLTPLRRLISAPVFGVAKGVLPSISETEQLALDAGDSWYEKEIFQGKPDFKKLHALKKFEMTAEEQSFLDNETETLCRMLDDWKVTHEQHDLPVEVWNYIRQNKFFGLVIHKDFGGLGFSASAHSQIVMKVASKSTTAGVTVMVPNSLGPGELIYHYGTKEQKNYYLPRLATGLDIPCFGLTGPTAGSDATSIPDLGTVTMGEYNGKQVLGIRLTNINKRYITLAPVATVIGLAFKLADPDGLLKGVGRTGITCALLPNDLPGLEIGNRLLPLDQVFMNGTIRIKDVFIPIDWIIGGQKMAGEGWRMLVECLSIGRAISLPACSTGNALMSTVMTSSYATVREQFNVSVGSFEGVEEGLGKMGGLTYMMNATRKFTVVSVDCGIKPSVASAISKYHLTETGRVVMNWAMDIHAGRAVIMGPNNYLGRVYQGVPVGITVEGANIMTRNLLIYGQGVMQSHPYLRKIYESLMTNQKAEFDRAMFGFAGYFSQNLIRGAFNGLTAGMLAKGYSSKYSCYYKSITRLSSAFALVGDSAVITLGGEFKRRERISARLGDVMSFLYMACATLKNYEDNGKKVSDESFVEWSLKYCLYNAQNALLDVLDNYSISSLGKVYKFLLFPYGRPYKQPSDKLEYKIAKQLLDNKQTRNDFKSELCIPLDEKDPMGRVEVAYHAVLAAQPIKAKIKAAIRAKKLPKASVFNLIDKALEAQVITAEEATKLQLAAKHTNEVIQTDEFTSEYFGPRNALESTKYLNSLVKQL